MGLGSVIRDVDSEEADPKDEESETFEDSEEAYLDKQTRNDWPEEQEESDLDEDEDEDTEGAVGEVSPIDLTSPPDDWDPLQHKIEVPLMPFELDEVRGHCRAWKQEDPKNVFAHQVLRALHELEEVRSEQTASILANSNSGNLEMQLAMAQETVQALRVELENAKKIAAAAGKISDMLSSQELDEKILGARIETLDVGDLFGAQQKLPEERDD